MPLHSLGAAAPLDHEREEDKRQPPAEEDWEWQARKWYPHLSKSVVPRESDEQPTYWEGQ